MHDTKPYKWKVEQRLPGAGVRENGELVLMGIEFVWDDEKVQKIVVMLTQHCECT